jgi:ankyrin repeat protein
MSTPLHWAIEAVDSEGVRKLLAEGLPVDPRDSAGRTPLRYATDRLMVEAAGLLLGAGADVDAADVAGVTSLMAVFRFNYDHDAGFAGSTYYPTDISPEERQTIRLLLDHGADVNRRDVAGRTAAHYAASHLNSSGFELLIAVGADLSVRDENGQTIYDVANDARWDTLSELTSADTFAEVAQRIMTLAR